MIVHSGQYHLPEVMEAIQSQGLKYWWIFCSKLNHYHPLVHTKHIYNAWKPLLFYVKGNRPKYSTDSMSDFILSSEPDKAIYKYEQSVEEASYIIKHLTVENQIVFDPMCGSCTTGIAALANGRKFIACEKDKEVFELAKKRISQYINH
jgi:DNA modification methylase